jgi:hypothetical protein
MLAGALLSSAEIDKNELRKYRNAVQISGARDETRSNSGKENEMLYVDFKAENDEANNELLKKVKIRFLLEVTDKKTKQAYYVKKEKDFGTISTSGNRNTGEGYWTLQIPYGDEFQRLEISAYTLQFGIMSEGEFVPFSEEYKDVKTYDDMLMRTTTAFPKDVTITRTLRSNNDRDSDRDSGRGR